MTRINKFSILALFLAIILPVGINGQKRGNDEKTRDQKVYFVPFSHFDLMWAGTREECLSRSNRIIVSALNLAKKQPDFHFMIEDMVFIDNFVQSHPVSGELKYLKQLVKEGRFEISPKWAGIFQNLPGGEVHVRNYLYGKRYARQVFNVNPLVSHQGDIPGFTPQYPQILAKSDVPYMIMTRLGPENNSLFNWIAPDGSKALVWDTKKGYGWGVNLGFHKAGLTDDEKSRIKKEVNDMGLTTVGPIYMGWGVDLWSPNEKLIENINTLNKENIGIDFIPATSLDYFKAASETPGLKNICGEIPNAWPSVSSSFPHMWNLGISATSTLLSAEKLAAINSALGYADYPKEEFDYMWKKLIESMDHNHDGQGGFTGDNRKIEYSNLSLIRGGEILRDMARNIAEKVEIPFKKCFPIVVFNLNGWSRSDFVTAHISVYGDVGPYQIDEYKKGLRLVDENGVGNTFFVTQYTDVISRSFDLIFVAENVPGLGYKTYYLVPADKAEDFPMSTSLDLDSEHDKKNVSRPLGIQKMENSFYSVNVDRATGRVSVYDKDLNKVVCKDMEIVALEERGGNNPNPEELTGRTIFNSVNSTGIEEQNAVRTVFKIEGQIADIPVIQRLILYRSLKRLDIENTIDWKERRYIRMEQLFPFQEDGEIFYGVPFGASNAKNLMLGAGPRSKDEIQKEAWEKYREIQDWIFAGTSDWGFTIGMNHYLVRLDKNLISTQMLRGLRWTSGRITSGETITTNPYPPAGQYIFRYTFSSGSGDWKNLRSFESGTDFNTPLVPVSVADELSAKTLPPSKSFIKLSSDNIVLSAVKKAEDDSDLILRFYEIKGLPSTTSVEWMGTKQDFREVNLLEEKLTMKSQDVLNVNPYEIKTVKIQIK